MIVMMLLVSLFAVKSDASGIEITDLPLAAQTIYGVWCEDGRFFPDTVSWSGSAFVLRRESDNLLLVTNRHCLGLDDIEEFALLRFPVPPSEGSGLGGMFGSVVGAVGGTVERLVDPNVIVGEYMLFVEFNSGQVVEVEAFRFACDHDIAMLRIPASGLSSGRDFLVPESYSAPVSIGSDVAAVGAPYGLGSSVTFGRVSAVRDYPSTYGNASISFIQTDAAINSGNSGGPLLVLTEDGRHFLAGINTLKHMGEGLGFAIAISELDRCSYSRWFAADANGMCEALSEQN